MYHRCVRLVNYVFTPNYSFIHPQIVLLAEVRSNFPRKLWLKALSEMVNRMPLRRSTSTASTSSSGGGNTSNSSRSTAPPTAAGAAGALGQQQNISHSSSSQQQQISLTPLATASPAETLLACQRACGMVFDILVQQMKALRDAEEFNSVWTRFVTVLATNAHTASGPRGQWWHDEMCDMLEALLRLLRLPSAPPAAEAGPLVVGTARRNSKELAADGGDGTVGGSSDPIKKSSGGGGGYLGILSWIIAAIDEDVDAVAPARRAQSAAAKERSASASASVPATDAVPSSSSQVAASGSSASSVVSSGSGTCADAAGVASNIVAPWVEDCDAVLLRATWRAVCAAYPAFPASLRLRDPKLHARLVLALQHAETYSFAYTCTAQPPASPRSPSLPTTRAAQTATLSQSSFPAVTAKKEDSQPHEFKMANNAQSSPGPLLTAVDSDVMSPGPPLTTAATGSTAFKDLGSTLSSTHIDEIPSSNATAASDAASAAPAKSLSYSSERQEHSGGHDNASLSINKSTGAHADRPGSPAVNDSGAHMLKEFSSPAAASAPRQSADNGNSSLVTVYDTPLANERLEMSFPTPVTTPAAAGAGAAVGGRGFQHEDLQSCSSYSNNTINNGASTIVKNLTPVFAASAQAQSNNNSSRTAFDKSNSNSSPDVDVVRQLNMSMVSPPSSVVPNRSATTGDSSATKILRNPAAASGAAVTTPNSASNNSGSSNRNSIWKSGSKPTSSKVQIV